MKKVLFLILWLFGYGGTETVIHNLFREYYKNDFSGYIFNSIKNIYAIRYNNIIKLNAYNIIVTRFILKRMLKGYINNYLLF